MMEMLENWEDKYNYYITKQREEPYYTEIPKWYFEVNEKIKTIDYIKEKLKKDTITSADLYDACEKYPEVFAWHMLGVLVRPYQHYAMDVMRVERFIAIAWSRRLGKSTIVKIFMLWSSIFNKNKGTLTGTSWNCVLQDQDIANALYIEPMHEFMERGNVQVSNNFKGAYGDDFFNKRLVTRRDKFGKVKSDQIAFKLPKKDGTHDISRIFALPPTNKVIGREGNIIGDEVSKWKHNSKVRDEFKYYDQLTAISKENPIMKLIFLSTPEGTQDMFALEIFDPERLDPDNRYSKIWFAYWVNVDDYWLEEMRISRANAIKKGRLALFQQEYEAKFVIISDAFFPHDELTKAIVPSWKQTYEFNMPCSLGLDWGGSQKSETAWAIYKWDTNPKSLRLPIAIKNYPVGDDLLYLKGDLKMIKNNYNIKWVIPDNKGGRFMITDLEEMFGKARVQPLNFTTEKQMGYELLRQGIMDGTVKLPNYIPAVKQLQELTDKLKPNSSKGNDDLADVIMLANYPLLNQNKYKKFGIVKDY